MTQTPPAQLPEFASPPVVEVALSLQFEPLAALNVGVLGLFWSAVRGELPQLQEQPPLPQVIESFESPPTQQPLQLQMFSRFQPRCWFLSSSGSELVQVQSDRFIFNWRSTPDAAEYPRYPYVKSRFIHFLEQFNEITAREGIPELVCNQCEVTYTNQIRQNAVWQRFGQLNRLIAPWSGEYSSSLLSEPEDIQLQERHRIVDENGAPIGRLHIQVQPAFSSESREPILLVSLTARGAPTGSGIGGAIDFLDLGRDHVVQGFASITTPAMHDVWGRTR